MKKVINTILIGLILLIIIIFSSKSIYATLSQDGVLDLTFNPINGYNYLDFSSFGAYNSYTKDVVSQPDGKVVVVGYAIPQAGGSKQFAIGRFNADGTIDASFSSGGSNIYSINSDDAEFYACALQSDGKIVAVGYYTYEYGSDYNPNLCIYRFNNDGSLDGTFGTGGIYYLPYSMTDEDKNIGIDIAVDYSGNLIVLGTFNGTMQLALYKINSTGTSVIKRTRYGGNYSALTPFTPVKLAIQSNQKIIVCGYTSDVGPLAIITARFNSDLSVDNTFQSPNCYRETNPPTDYIYPYVTSLALQSDGKIIIGGYASSTITDYDNFMLVRFNSDGSLDNAFGSTGNGFEIDHFVSWEDTRIYNIAIDQWGKIIAVGSETYGTSNPETLAVARYYSNGIPDNTFYGTSAYRDFFGIRTSYFFHGEHSSVAVQNDGKIILASYDGYAVSTPTDFLVIRLIGTPPPATPSITVWAAAILVLLMLGFGLKFVYKKNKTISNIL